MPMSFPDLKSLEMAAKCHKFREKSPDESESQYRAALADHVTPLDKIEGHEIRTAKSWDTWDTEDRQSFLAALSRN